ncbi:MAG TPA: hypothetical protein VH277_05985 [Gemmatimonadaceae bacterium]|jgi:hypothetical protein|nr:hypothetical protein [Gemmatimonadaceae bacterium]
MLSLSLNILVAGIFGQILAAQGPAVRAAAPADSARLVRGVRSAQSSFEAFRRSRLPVGEHASGLCDVRIGRYCYWRGDGEEPDPPAEPEAIQQRRTSLIRLLDSAAWMLPGDAWIDGQYVRYLVEAGQFDDAVGFLRRCTAESSWCLALSGYAAHSAGRFALADSIYAEALARMPASERCRWLDVSDVLSDDLQEEFNRIGCDDRRRFVRRTFRISAPLYSMATTDLLTEHLARLTRARIAERAATPDGESWADDQRELVVRYGWPRWYTRWEPAFGSQMQRSITGHDAGMPFDFIPSLHAIHHVSEIDDEDWHLDNARAVTGYAPSFAKTVHELPSQMARFRRGDSTLVVAAWDARKDTTMLGRTLEASLVVLDDSSTSVERMDSVRTRGHISMMARADSGIISLELLAAKERRAARSRRGFATRAPSRVSLSDLLLYAPGDSSPLSVAAASDSALTSEEIANARPVGVFWETYGLRERGEHVRFTLTVEQVEVGWMRRAAERMHLSDPTSGLRIQWDEVPLQHDGVAPRAVRLDLSRLRHGRYRVTVSAMPDGEAAVEAVRYVVVGE